MDAAACHNVLFGYDADCNAYISHFADAETAPVKSSSATLTLREAVLRGLSVEARAAAAEMLKVHAPMEVVESELVPALNQVGEGFELKNCIPSAAFDERRGSWSSF